LNNEANGLLRLSLKPPRKLICLFWWLLALTTGVEAHANPNSPSVILISVDTLRADHLSCYGYRANQTPHIDALVRGGTLFYQISAQVPLTLPSHASLLTSTYPFFNGIEDNGLQLGSNAVTLATVLKSQGYRTAAFVGGFVLDRRFGLSQGFDVYDSPFDVNRERVGKRQRLSKLDRDPFVEKRTLRTNGVGP